MYITFFLVYIVVCLFTVWLFCFVDYCKICAWQLLYLLKKYGEYDDLRVTASDRIACRWIRNNLVDELDFVDCSLLISTSSSSPCRDLTSSVSHSTVTVIARWLPARDGKGFRPADGCPKLETGLDYTSPIENDGWLNLNVSMTPRRKRIREKIRIDVNRFCRDVKQMTTPSEWIHRWRQLRSRKR